MQSKTRQTGFTLVELLVVISIIALLIAIALPSFRGARNAAKRAATQSTITSLGTALSLFQAESALGGGYPPSASDSILKPGMIDSPYHSGGTYANITGASLLVYALAGPDLKGTAGFKASGGSWADVTGGYGSKELYDSDDNSRVPMPRYGPYAEGNLFEKIQPMRMVIGSGPNEELIGIVPEGKVLAEPTGWTAEDMLQRFFVDEFGRPILYYKARSAARYMLTDPSADQIGVYDHRDNAMLTGGQGYGNAWVGALMSPDTTGEKALGLNTLLEFQQYIFSSATPFESLNGDQRLKARPVNSNTYLLISAGEDGIYGTLDDVKNWAD